MIRLNLAAEPFWFDTHHGVKLKLAPLTSAVMMAARSDPAVLALGEDAPRNQRALAVCKAIARLTVLEWEGVTGPDDAPAEPSPENIDAILDLWPIYETFELDYVAPALVLDAEKNV